MTTDGPAEVSAAPPARSGRGLLLSLVITDVVILLDVLTKHWAVSTLAGEPPHHVVWTLQWNLAYNSGMAFSSGKGMGPVIGVLALAIGVAMLVAVRRQPSRLARVAAGLVAGGAFGNVIDRLFRGDGWFRGSVVDFIDFQWFPIFNVADMAVNVGGALFVVWSLFSHEGDRQQADQAEVPT